MRKQYRISEEEAMMIEFIRTNYSIIEPMVHNMAKDSFGEIHNKLLVNNHDVLKVDILKESAMLHFSQLLNNVIKSNYNESVDG